MGGLFDGGLTKTGVQNGNSTQFYDQPAEAAVAAAHDTVAPTYRAQLPNQIQEGDTPAAKIPFAQDTASYSPKIVKPSFKEATTDPSGMPRTINPSETKMGKLLHVLSSAAQGGLAGQAASEQAVAASGGHRSAGFGTGFQAAQVAPFQRAAMQNNAQRDALQTKVAQSQLEQQNTPIQMPDGTTMAPWQWKRQQEQQAAAAELALKAAQTRQAGSVADKNEKDATVPPDQQTYNYLIKQGKTPDQALEIIKGAGQSDKAPTNAFQAYQAAFKAQNNRDMTPQEISAYEKQHAQNIHINNVPASESDYTYVANQLLDPYNLTALKDVAGRGGKERSHIFALTSKLAQERGQTFDPGVIDRRIKFLDSYEDPKGRASINRQAINNIFQHAGDMQELNQQFWKAGLKVANVPINAVRGQFGDEAYTKVQMINTVLKDELSLYFAGGYAPSAEQQGTWNKILSDELPTSAVEAFAKEIGKLSLRRAATFNSQFKTMMGYDDPNMIIPEAAAAAARLGLGEEVKKFRSGGQIGDRGGSGSGGSGKPQGTRPPLSSFEKPSGR